jgi:FtsP/CotA-like multicopper oxidase with cupredoxin domain
MVSVNPRGKAGFRTRPPLSAILLVALTCGGFAPTNPEAPRSTPSEFAFDFSDEVYQRHGIDPHHIRDRLQEGKGLAVADPASDPSRRGLRALEWRGGYDAAGCLLFFHRFGALGRDAFESTPAGDQARRIGEEFRVYTFPRRQNPGRRLLARDRQDPVFDTTPGYRSGNPLGLWRAVPVVFSEEAFRSRQGLAAMEEIRRRNGTDRDGTPILCHPSEIRLLEQDGFVRLGTPETSPEAPWVLWPIHDTVRGERLPADAFPAFVVRDEGSAVEPMLEHAFFCLSRSGILGASRVPRLPPFVQALPIPPILEPRAALDPPPDGVRLQGFAEAPPVDFFEVHERPFLHRFHPDLPASPLWGYDGAFPGPTIRVRRGRPFLLRVWNDLPAGGDRGIGQPRTVCRPELFPVASDSAGFPEDHYPPGQFKDHYCSSLAGAADDRPTPLTGCYRDGRLGFSAQNRYRGLEGFMTARDAADSGDENDPSPGAGRLPSGAQDIPLLLAERSFDESLDHALSWDAVGGSACAEDSVTVNGALQPYLRVARRKYRFRLWNGGPSRPYELSLSSGSPMHVIAADGILLEAPIASPTVPLQADQRRDVLIDFSAVKIGSSVYLEDRSVPVRSGLGAVPGVPRKPSRLLRFQVDRDAPDPSRIPARLSSASAVDPTSDLPVRTFTFSDVRGVWMLNGKPFDLDRADAVVRPGAREIWVLKNDSTDVTHPIRLPAEGRPLPQSADPSSRFPDPGLRLGELAPGQEARLLMHLPSWTGKYVLGCGDSVREDQGFLFRWDVSR